MTFEELLKKWNGGIAKGAQLRLAKELGLSHPSISRWITTGFLPSEEIRPKLAKMLGVSVPELLSSLTETKRLRQSILPGNTVLPQSMDERVAYKIKESLQSPILEQVTFVPVRGEVSAETFKFSIEDSVITETLPLPALFGNKVFGLKIRGKCWEPEAHDGSYAYVQQANYASPGQIVIACTTDSECTMKRFTGITDGIMHLTPLNPKFKALKHPAEEVKIIGVVIGFFNFPSKE